jgi:hypothetical protein
LKKRNRLAFVVELFAIAAAPTIKMIEAIRKLLSLPYLSGIKYSQWENEIITWLPKEEDNPDIAKRRPITLLEVMKKMHILSGLSQFLRCTFLPPQGDMPYSLTEVAALIICPSRRAPRRGLGSFLVLQKIWPCLFLLTFARELSTMKDQL